MILHHDSDAPAPPRGVERRLRELDPRLRLTWSRWALDYYPESPTFGRPLSDPKGNPVPAVQPNWHLWVQDKYNIWHHLVEAPVCDDRMVQWVEQSKSIARNGDIGEHLSVQRKRRAEELDRQKASLRADRQHWIRENRKRFHDSIFEGKHHRRDAKIFSGGGTEYRGTSTEQVPIENDGWTPSPNERG